MIARRQNLEPEFAVPVGTDEHVRTIEHGVQLNFERILKDAPVYLELLGYQPESRWVFDTKTHPEGIDYFAMEEVFPTIAQLGDEPGTNAQDLKYMNVQALIPSIDDGITNLDIEFHWNHGIVGTLATPDGDSHYLSIEQQGKILATHPISREVFACYVINCGLPIEFFGGDYRRKLPELALHTTTVKQSRSTSLAIDATSQVSLSHHTIQQTDPRGHHDTYETMDVTLDHLRDDAIYQDVLTFTRHRAIDEWQYHSMYARNMNKQKEKLTVPTSGTVSELNAFFTKIS